jgi:hypothetical protein
MIISIDFDGTISRGKFPAITGLQPYAAEVINRLYQQGHYLIINTCRSGEQCLEAVNFLLQHCIPFHRVNDNHPDQTALYNNNSRKIYAHVYIDDKNLGGFPGWLQAEETINQMELEYKTKTT